MDRLTAPALEIRAGLRARELLDAGATPDEIAPKLGYADRASFVRAFDRWAGATPTTQNGVRAPRKRSP